ncbi:polygalacturonase At1g48100-like isoform X1 [Salvia miltiorrhiza]|uniref:polygalacturonase At1g48100-like isoform X1 n=1 Tax=Salvia miltiorrhiza TaxID=226208 RepID=UPI0025ABA63D|nr:polygalacturonase At1g48100-like isoform X1 [Salvia miltiorrhiza]
MLHFPLFLAITLHSFTLSAQHRILVSQISASPSPAPQLPPPLIGVMSPSPLFSVLSYGAVGNGVADDTQPFKMAWDAACQANDPAVIFVPMHYTFMIQSTIFSGPCKSELIFRIEGNIMAPDGPHSWPKNNSKRQWLVFYRIDGMSIQGGGTIDGRGQKWWELPCKPHRGPKGTTLPGPCDSPVAVRFFWSSNLVVKGMKMKNSPQFHFRFDSCHNVHIESLYIKSPALSPNTDGIHVENSNNVYIYNSVIASGDDCVSIGAGTFNVEIRNITCGPGHGISCSIGSLGPRNTRACVKNITVRDSVIKQSDNGVRIKTWQGGYGAVTGVSYSNIVMEGVRNPIMIDQYYCTGKSCANQTAAVYISGISYKGIKGTYDVRSPAMHLACSDAVPCTNLTVSDVELLPVQGQRIVDPYCWNAYGDGGDDLNIPPLFCLIEGAPPLLLPSNGLDQC